MSSFESASFVEQKEPRIGCSLTDMSGLRDQLTAVLSVLYPAVQLLECGSAEAIEVDLSVLHLDVYRQIEKVVIELTRVIDSAELETPAGGDFRARGQHHMFDI